MTRATPEKVDLERIEQLCSGGYDGSELASLVPDLVLEFRKLQRWKQKATMRMRVACNMIYDGDSIYDAAELLEKLIPQEGRR